MGFKGPKALLSSAIADALSEYFIVEASLIESNLLTDTKIVLHDVLLREQVTTLPKNTTGCPTVITITGSVQEVSFTWEWTTGGNSWVKNAKLTIKSLNFKAKLEHGTPEEPVATLDESKEEDSSTTAELNPDAPTAKEVQKEGGMKAYLLKHVEMMIDALTLEVLGFELTIEVPSPMADSGLVSIVVGGESAVVLSFGRELDPETQHSLLCQTLTITGFCARLLQASDTTPLVDPFSYGAEVIRAGKRFGGIVRGVKVTGHQITTERDSGPVFHVGETQIQALSQLGVMLLAAPGTATEKPPPSKNDGRVSQMAVAEETSESQTGPELKPSSFGFSMASVSVVSFKNQKFRLLSVLTSYLADGSVLTMEAKEFVATDDSGGYRLLIHGIHGAMKPNMVVRFDAIETCYLQGSFELLAPIRDTSLEFQGATLMVKLVSVEGAMLSGESTSTADESAALSGSNVAASGLGKASLSLDGTTPRPNVSIPFPVSLTLQKALLRRDNKMETYSELKEIEIFLNPTSDGTQFAVCVAAVSNKLMNLKGAKICATRPIIGRDVLENLVVAAESISVHAGHSTHEWSDTILLSEMVQLSEMARHPVVSQSVTRSSRSPASQKQVWRFPFAHVDALKVTITYSGTGISVKHTSFIVRQFVGKAKTTSRDLVSYYTGACIAKTANFITNAEVLGLNLADRSVSTYGAYAGMATPVGAAGGVAVLTAVDAVKGAVAAGKRSRSVDEADKWAIDDFFRGVVVAASESTKKGAIERGKKEEDADLVDWAVGATTETAKYVGENKSRLGGAGGAGVGMAVGMMIGGPIGGIIGGVLGGAVTEKSIDKIEEKKKISK